MDLVGLKYRLNLYDLIKLSYLFFIMCRVNVFLISHVRFSGKTLILKEMAIRKAKSTSSNLDAEEEQENIDPSKSTESTEEENDFLAGFGSFDFDDENDSSTTSSDENVPEETKESLLENNEDRTQNKVGSSDQGTLLYTF